MTKRSLKYFDIAKKLSKKSQHKFQIGSVIVRGSKVLGLGFNTVRTHTRSNHPFKSIHSELSSILSAGREDLKGSSIYLYRETRNGSLANCKPCEFCRVLIEESKIKYIYYTDIDGYKRIKCN